MMNLTGRRVALKSLFLIGSSTIAFAGAANAQNRTTDFDVPAQPASTAIPEFARMADIQILVSAGDVQGKRTNTIHGMLTVRDALTQLLAGTGIMVRSDDGRTIVLSAERSTAAGEDRAMPAPAQTQSGPSAPPQLAQAAPAPAMPMVLAQMGPTEVVPEQVLVTGSLIHGAAAVGVPVTNLSPQDFTQTGAVTTADLFRTIPAANVEPGPVATESGQRAGRPTFIDIRGLGTTRELLMVDGMRYPPGEKIGCTLDPSIIPQLGIDRIDVLVDGASASYGSDAVSGVVNIILKRGFDGAVTQLQYTGGAGGMNNYRASQLWGRTWDGGDITLSYEYYDNSPVRRPASNFTVDFSPWGFDNRIPLASSVPGILSFGNPTSASAAQSATLGNNCNNCFAIPKGTGVSFVGGNGGLGPGTATNPRAPTLTWNGTTFVAVNGSAQGTAAGFGASGTANEFDPYNIAWFSAAEQRNGSTVTVDQRLLPFLTFSGEGFYSNRRAQFLNPSNISPASNNDLSITVPTTNPYYPTALPAGQRNIVANLNMGVELPSVTSAYQVSARSEAEFKINLPGNWLGRIYYADNLDHNFNAAPSINKNAVSAALGWTLNATAASGTAPGISTWTKPAAVPYLNLFCDFSSVACNSQAALDYIEGLRTQESHYGIKEAGAVFDGPLFDLPGGQVKAAVGGTYDSTELTFSVFDSTGSPTLVSPVVTALNSRNIWAGFAQLNVPIFGDSNALPLLRRLEVEASWRHDQYSDFGGTSNPKIALTWVPHEWVTLRGSWGTNFVAPAFSFLNPLGNVSLNAFNTAAFPSQPAQAFSFSCAAPAGSAAGKLAAGGAPCGPNVFLPGISQVGSAGTSIAAGFRSVANAQYAVLQPETTNQWSGGLEFAPTGFLQGLDLQATWFSIKINNALQGVAGTPSATTINNPVVGFMYVVPSDLAAPLSKMGNAADAAACAGADASPWTCPEFVQMVRQFVNLPKNVVPSALIPAPGNPNSAYWIGDGGTINSGFVKLSGIDFNGSYDWDGGDFGAWNIGITGTYYLHSFSASTTSPPLNLACGQLPDGSVDAYHACVNQGTVAAASGVETAPRLRYRARLGWSDGPLSATLFVNYQSHFFHTQNIPNNVNGNFCQSNGITAGGTLPCIISNYSNMLPSYYTFDLSLGYDTGDAPANDYLRHIGVQFIVQDLMNKHPPFEYATSTGGQSPSAFDLTKPDLGRVFSVIVTKTW